MTDWDKELAKIDKQLASMSDADLVAPAPTQPVAATRGALPAPKGKTTVASAEPAAAPLGRGAKFALYGRLGLSVALGVGMMFWPYPAKCGPGLGLYLGAVTAVVVSGVWSAVWSWRHRASRLHLLSLLILTWGLVLGGLEILPRAGYAKPSVLHPAEWACK